MSNPRGLSGWPFTMDCSDCVRRGDDADYNFESTFRFDSYFANIIASWMHRFESLLLLLLLLLLARICFGQVSSSSSGRMCAVFSSYSIVGRQTQ